MLILVIEDERLAVSQSRKFAGVNVVYGNATRINRNTRMHNLDYRCAHPKITLKSDCFTYGVRFDQLLIFRLVAMQYSAYKHIKSKIN